MPVEAPTCLRDVFCEVVEVQAFMFGDPVEAARVPARVADCYQAQILFAGPCPGRLRLLAPEALARSLVENLLGPAVDGPAGDRAARDALGELLNVTCGQLLTALVGSEAVIDLLPPQVTKVDAAAWEAARAHPESVAFCVDDHPVLLCLELAR